MKIYPVAGRLVLDPVTGREIKDAGGTEVPADDSFWLRRIADGDVATTAPQGGAKKGAE